MQPMRQGDVTVLPLAQTVGVTVPQELRTKLPNLTLAKGEVTANKYPIGEGKAELLKKWHITSYGCFQRRQKP